MSETSYESEDGHMTISTDLPSTAALHDPGVRELPECASAGVAERRPLDRSIRRRRAHMSGAAVAGMMLGIFSIPLVFSYLSPVALVAIVVSHIGLRQCEREGRRGWAFAIAGLAMGYGSLALTLLAVFGVSTAG